MYVSSSWRFIVVSSQKLDFPFREQYPLCSPAVMQYKRSPTFLPSKCIINHSNIVLVLSSVPPSKASPSPVPAQGRLEAHFTPRAVLTQNPAEDASTALSSPWPGYHAWGHNGPSKHHGSFFLRSQWKSVLRLQRLHVCLPPAL